MSGTWSNVGDGYPGHVLMLLSLSLGCCILTWAELLEEDGAKGSLT